MFCLFAKEIGLFLWVAAVTHVTTFSTFKFAMHISELESTNITCNDYSLIVNLQIMLYNCGHIGINVETVSIYTFETYMYIIINLPPHYKMIGLFLYHQDLDFE